MTATSLARTIIGTLVREGVRTFVLAPGSRSAPFAYALYDAAQAGVITLQIETDERVAGFVALGSGIAGSPAAVVTTSGTAVANLHPAVEEAHHAGVPFVVLSADRPLGVRGVRANQTTDHLAILRGSMRHSAELPTDANTRQLAGKVRRAARIAQGIGFGASGSGPVHLNIGLAEPLDADGTWTDVVAQCAPETEQGPENLRTVVVAGPTTLTNLDLGVFDEVPVLAEPTAALWEARNALVGHPILLGTALRDMIERVVVVGHPTLSREVQSLLGDPAIEVVVVDEPPMYTDVSGNSRRVVMLDEVARWLTTPDPHWLEHWRTAEKIVIESIDENVDPMVLTTSFIARVLSANETPTVLGASSIIREVNLYATPGTPFLGNRGLAGIDGTISTAIGYAIGSNESVRVVLGDLSALHDLGAMAPTVGQKIPLIDVVIIDDHGGSIFAGLEHGKVSEDVYSRVFRTEKNVSLKELAEAMDAQYAPVSDVADFLDVIETMPSELRIVHIDLGRETAVQTRAARSSLRSLIADDLDAFSQEFSAES